MADSTKLTGGEKGVGAEERKPSPRLEKKMLEGVPERARSALDEQRKKVLGLLAGVAVYFEKPAEEGVRLVVEGQHDTRPLMEALGAEKESSDLLIPEPLTEMPVMADYSFRFCEPPRIGMLDYNFLPMGGPYFHIVAMEGDSALIGASEQEMRLEPGMYEANGLRLNVSVENGELFLSVGSGKSEPVKIVGVAGERAIVRNDDGEEVMVRVLDADAIFIGLSPSLMVQIVTNIQRSQVEPYPAREFEMTTILISPAEPVLVHPFEWVVEDGTEKPK